MGWPIRKNGGGVNSWDYQTVHRTIAEMAAKKIGQVDAESPEAPLVLAELVEDDDAAELVAVDECVEAETDVINFEADADDADGIGVELCTAWEVERWPMVTVDVGCADCVAACKRELGMGMDEVAAGRGVSKDPDMRSRLARLMLISERRWIFVSSAYIPEVRRPARVGDCTAVYCFQRRRCDGDIAIFELGRGETERYQLSTH